MSKKLFLALCVLSCMPVFAFAHTTGFFVEKIVDTYLFDIGYSSDLIAGDFIRFNLVLAKAATKEPIPFSDAWVRISKGEKLLFAGPIAYGEFGKPGFSFVFPDAGDYSLSVRFEKGLTSISEATIPLTVKPASDSGQGGIPTGPFIFGAIGIALGFIGGKLLKKHA